MPAPFSATFVDGKQTEGDVLYPKEKWDELVAQGGVQRTRVARANSETVTYQALDAPEPSTDTDIADTDTDTDAAAGALE